MSHELPSVYLARHGETAWTLSHQHTGRSDIPLTARGELNATSLGERLRGVVFQKVLTSPLGRARRTCELAGLLDQVVVDPELTEWDYGEYDGLTTVEIRRKNPALAALPRRLPRRRVGRTGRRARRSRDRAVASDCRKAARLRPRSFFARAGGPMARAAGRSWTAVLFEHGVAFRSRVTSIRSRNRRSTSGTTIAMSEHQ